MGKWHIIQPSFAILNFVYNPQAGADGNFAAYNGSTVTRNLTHLTGYSKFGRYAYKIANGALNRGIELNTFGLGIGTIYITAFIRATGTTSPPATEWSLNASTWRTPSLLYQIDPYWGLWGEWFPSGLSSTSLYIRQSEATPTVWYVDGVMAMNALTDATDEDRWYVYVDGEQPGCFWRGVPHASVSEGSYYSRRVGELVDLEATLGLEIAGIHGAGAAPVKLSVQPYSHRAGGELTGKRATSRSWSLLGSVRGATWAAFHSRRQELDRQLRSAQYAEDEGGRQPVRIWYTAAEHVKEIEAFYEGGLDLTYEVPRDMSRVERLALRFYSPDPFWREIGETADKSDSQRATTVYYAAHRRKRVGWENMDIGSAGGTTPLIRAIVRGPDNKIYVGGDFDDLDGSGANHIAVYDPDTYTWSAFGGSLNNEVWGLAFLPDGDLVAVGQFTNAGGVDEADYIAQIDPDAGIPVWTAIGNPNSGGAAITGIYCVTVDREGRIIIGGDFTQLEDDGNCDRAAYWTGSAWDGFGTGFANGIVYALAVGLDNTIWFGGTFTGATSFNGDEHHRVAGWDWTGVGSTVELTDGITTGGSAVRALMVDRRDNLWIGGDFTTVKGDAIAAWGIAMWNGNAWFTVGDGGEITSGGVYAIMLGPDDAVWVGGSFQSWSGSLPIYNGLAKFVGCPPGGSWAPVSMQLPSTPTVYCITRGQQDPISARIYDVYIGFDKTGTAYHMPWAADGVEGDDEMTEQVYPRLVVHRSGGTSATLVALRSTQDGKEIHFNYALADGELVTVDLDPSVASFESDFYGLRDDAILPSSDLGTMAMLPRAYGSWVPFVYTTGDPTITVALLWRKTFSGVD